MSTRHREARQRLARPPAPRRAPGAPGPPAGPAPAVPFAALATLLGLTVGAGPSAEYSFTLDGTGGLAVGAAGTGAYRTGPDLAMRMTFDEFAFSGVALPGGMEERVVGGTVYVRSGLLGPGSGWVRLPLDGSATGFGDLDRLLDRAREVGGDAPVPLRRLLDAGHLTPSGADRVDGIGCTRYSGALEPGQLGITRVGMDVWVDGAGRVRRFVAVAPTAAGEIRMALTFADVAGEPVIEAPAVLT